MPPGRRSAVEVHPDRDEIVRKLAAGQSHASIAREHGISTGALHSYVIQHPVDRDLVRQGQAFTDLQSILKVANYTAGHLTELTEAVKAYLADPDDPKKLTMDLHAREIEVVYTDTIDDPTNPDRQVKIKRRAMLQGLINQIRERNPIAYDFNLTVKRSDDREIYIKSIHELNETSAALTRSIAMLTEAGKQDVPQAAVLGFFMADLKRALADFPGAFEAVISYFDRRSREGPAA